jgi:hypothetical protein
VAPELKFRADTENWLKPVEEEENGVLTGFSRFWVAGCEFIRSAEAAIGLLGGGALG